MTSDYCFFGDHKDCPGDAPEEVGDYGATFGGRGKCRCECHKKKVEPQERSK